MATEKNDTVILELDRPRELKLTHKALKRFSALTGCSMADLGDQMQHYDKLTALVYCMLAADAERHGETLTPDRVDDLLENVPFDRLITCATAAIQAAFGSGEETEGDPQTAAGTGN